MKLEVGKYYRTLNGDKVFLRETDVEGCDGFGDPYGLYLPDGKFGYIENGRHLGACPDLDIIAEWTDTPEVGTLEEIGAQHGDQCGYGNGEWLKCTISMRDGKYYAKGEESDGELGGDQWRIISRAQTGPVRTVTTTRYEIVPGVYGAVSIISDDDGDRVIDLRYGIRTADELTAAIATLTAIRDAMQANATA